MSFYRLRFKILAEALSFLRTSFVAFWTLRRPSALGIHSRDHSPVSHYVVDCVLVSRWMLSVLNAPGKKKSCLKNDSCIEGNCLLLSRNTVLRDLQSGGKESCSCGPFFPRSSCSSSRFLLGICSSPFIWHSSWSSLSFIAFYFFSNFLVFLHAIFFPLLSFSFSCLRFSLIVNYPAFPLPFIISLFTSYSFQHFLVCPFFHSTFLSFSLPLPPLPSRLPPPPPSSSPSSPTPSPAGSLLRPLSYPMNPSDTPPRSS